MKQASAWMSRYEKFWTEKLDSLARYLYQQEELQTWNRDWPTKPSLTLNRHYPVAPEKVWRAWTDPEAVKKWWGPGPGEPVSLAELDVRVGGRFRIVFGGPDGKVHECAGVYKEVVPNRKLVFTWSWPNTHARARCRW